MKHQAKSIRPFIGAIDFELSRSFYRDLGFKENYISPDMCYFDFGGFGFYLQNAFVKDWIENTMVFMEVENVNQFWNELLDLELKTSSFIETPGVTNSVTPLLTMVLVIFGSSSWSQMATRSPALTNFGK